MARVWLEESFTARDPASVAARVYGYARSESMKVVRDSGSELELEQGSQITTRMLGGWILPARIAPKRARVRWREDGTVEARIEESLGFGWIDPIFRQKYEAYFREWMEGLRRSLA
jgi:hypothetical protein